MTNNYRDVVKERRDKVGLLLAKSITKPQMIAEHLDEDVGVIYEDVKYFKKQAVPWLDDLTFTGFVWECKNAIDKLKNIEEDMQKLRQDAKGIDEKLKVFHEIQYNINLQIETLANGPTLMELKKANGE